MQYEWKPAAAFRRGLDAQVVGEHLEQLRAKAAKLTAEVILADAERPDSPIHDAFTWDDSEAARLYRLRQARDLAGSIRVRFETPIGDPVETRAFVVVQAPRGEEEPARANGKKHVGDYTPIQEALGDMQKRAQVVATALEEFRALARRYRHLAELGAIFSAIDAMTGDQEAVAA